MPRSNFLIICFSVTIYALVTKMIVIVNKNVGMFNQTVTFMQEKFYPILQYNNSPEMCKPGFSSALTDRVLNQTDHGP
jgi:hypothetical protein